MYLFVIFQIAFSTRARCFDLPFIRSSRYLFRLEMFLLPLPFIFIDLIDGYTEALINRNKKYGKLCSYN